MSDCEQCAVLLQQNDLLANDRDGYVQLLTNENNKLRAQVDTAAEMLREAKARNTALRAENERLRAVLEDIAYPNPLHNEDDLMHIARAALEEK